MPISCCQQVVAKEQLPKSSGQKQLPKTSGWKAVAKNQWLKSSCQKPVVKKQLPKTSCQKPMARKQLPKKLTQKKDEKRSRSVIKKITLKIFLFLDKKTTILLPNYEVFCWKKTMKYFKILIFSCFSLKMFVKCKGRSEAILFFQFDNKH